MRKVHTEARPEPTRIERWQSPTGRWLEPGQTFKVEGRSGWFKFLAYVEADIPYVEARHLNSPNVRCIRPESITRTSKKGRSREEYRRR